MCKLVGRLTLFAWRAPCVWNGASRIFLRRRPTNALWKNLEEQSRTWDALTRQGLANAIWADYVTARFRRTGDPRTLDALTYFTRNPDLFLKDRAVNVVAAAVTGSSAAPLAYPIGIDEHGVNLAVLGVSESHCLSLALREIHPAALQAGHLHMWVSVRQPRRHLFVRIGLRTERSDGA